MLFLSYFTVGISVIFVSGFIKGIHDLNPKASVVFPTYYNYDKFVEQGEERISHAEDYNSYNTERLNIEGMKLLLMKLDFMQAAIRGEFVDSEE